MSGINTSGQNATDNYLLGGGILYLSDLEDGIPTGFRDLGETSALSISVENETLEHKSSRTGLKVVDLQITTSQKATGSFTLDSVLDFANLALFFSGSTTTVSNSAAVTGITGNGNVTAKLGKWVDLYKTATGAPASGAAADRVYDVGALTVKDNATDMVTYVLGTDYDVDLVMGRIFFYADGNIAEDEVLNVDTAAKAGAVTTVDVMLPLQGAPAQRALKFIGENGVEGTKKFEVAFHAVRLVPNGELAFIGEELAGAGFEFSIEPNTVFDPTSPYFRLVTHANS